MTTNVNPNHLFEQLIVTDNGPVQVIEVSTEHYSVVSPTGKITTFRGETAWSDAERFANDMLTDLRGTPFGERFSL